MPNDGDSHENSPEEQAPESAPERAARTPELDPVAGIVKAHDLSVGMIALADDAEIFHLEAGRGQLLYRRLCRIMLWKDRDN
jgi:hypothetical protein